jgi:ATP-dependent helicase/nuclease subunit B
MIEFSSFDQLKGHSESVLLADQVQRRLFNGALDRLAFIDKQLTWAPPHTQTWDQFVRGCFDSINLVRPNSFDFDFILSSDQERSLWFQIIREDLPRENSVTESTAVLAQAAHRIRSYWNVASSTSLSTDDNIAYSRWEKTFRAICKDLKVIDIAQFFDNHFPSRNRLDPFTAYGFFRPPPAVKHWLKDIHVEETQFDGAREIIQKGHKFPEREHEILTSLIWAMDIASREQTSRVALVVPDESQTRQQVDDLIHSYFEGSDTSYFNWANSCRTAVDRPFVRLALAILSVDEHMRWDSLSQLITNPLLVGAAQEQFERAELDEQLRGLDRYELTLKSVINFLKESGKSKLLCLFLERLSGLIETRRANLTVSDWTHYFRACLEATGCPETALADPRFTEDLSLWESSCDRLSSLGSVNSTVSKSFAESRMRAYLREPIVQIGNCRKNPVYIVNLEQAAFVQPTHTWILGCEADREFTSHKMSPFLGINQQRAAGVPGSDPNREYRFVKQLLKSLTVGLRELNVSYSQMVDEHEKRPLKIFSTLSECSTEDSAWQWPKTWKLRDVKWGCILDEKGPRVSINENLGGTKVLTDYNACAFKGFATTRLKAEPLAVPERGLSKRKKGELVHQVLAQLWSRLARLEVLWDMPRESLLKWMNEEINKILSALFPLTKLEKVLLEVEETRLRELMILWFEVEERSEEFEVLETEYAYSTQIGNLTFRMRADRIDRLANGSLRIVDYKTGNCENGAWLPSRMDDPQLPFYASTLPIGRVSSIAYAQVKEGQARYLSWPSNQKPKNELPQNWEDASELWESDLESTYGLIAEGNAAPFPKKGLDTCRSCDLQIFCRFEQKVVSKGTADVK